MIATVDRYFKMVSTARYWIERAKTINIKELPFASIKTLKELPDKSGIYIVRSGDACLYIGLSKNVRGRWIHVRSDGTPSFPHHRYEDIKENYPDAVVSYFLAAKHELIFLESALIRVASPVMNGPIKCIEKLIDEHFYQPPLQVSLGQVAGKSVTRIVRSPNRVDSIVLFSDNTFCYLGPKTFSPDDFTYMDMLECRFIKSGDVSDVVSRLVA